MLIYLPERLYENLKNDEKYHQLSKDYTEEFIHNNDFLNIIRQFTKVNPKLLSLFEYIRESLPKNQKIEFDIVMSHNLKEFQDKFDEMDVETKIYYLYAYDDGDMSWNEDAEKRNKLCIKLYEDNILNNDYICSYFIHTIYYLRIVYELIFKYTNRNISLKEFKNFVKEENEIFNKMMAKSSNESFKHIMYSKREQMYGLYLEFIGQFIDDEKIYQLLWEIVDNKEFKYNYFSYFKLSFFLIFFQKYADIGDITNAKKCLDKLLELISYAFEHKNDACDSLNHYNKAFIDDFLILSKFVYDMVSKYMPILDKKWCFLNNDNVKPAEYRFYKQIMTNDDKEIVKNFNVVDRFFSYSWINGKKEILSIIDKLYLDND